MPSIHRVVPERHIQTVINGLFHFAPCRSFVDLLEFRFAHCGDHYTLAQELGRPEIFDTCIRNSFSDNTVQEKIDGASIACWTTQPERPFMWEIYGHSRAAIILTLDENSFALHVRHLKGDRCATGPVRYGFAGPSSVRPEFIAGADRADLDHFDLFFHKHAFYSFEKEFRAVIFEPGPTTLPLMDDLVISVTLSPCEELRPDLLDGLRARFGNRVRESRWNGLI